MVYTNEIVPRILRDIDNGVLALDLHGRIIYINSPCENMIGKQETLIGKSYAEAIFDGPHAKGNDAFHQFVLDAVYQKESTHRGTVPFVDASGNVRFIRITSSFLKSESSDENVGIVLVLVDVTETETLKKRRFEAATIFACVICCLTVYLLVLGMLSFLNISVSTATLTHIVSFFGVCSAFASYKLTFFSAKDFGIVLENPKKTFFTAAVFAAAGVTFLILLKLALLHLHPSFFAEGAPFWNWNIGVFEWFSYAPTCVAQDFIIWGMTYGSIRRIYDGKYGFHVSLVLSALIFAGLHIGHSFFHMMAAALMIFLLAKLYENQRCVWGITVIHYVMGQAADCLGFLG